ncbi:MAG: ATP-binding protein [Pseudohongiellaceae bacterium]
MTDDPRIAELRRRIQRWLPADSTPKDDAGDPVDGLAADLTALERELNSLSRNGTTVDQTAGAFKEQAVLRTVLESVVEGVIVTDMDGRPLIFNQAAENLLGRGPTNDSGVSDWSEEFGLFRADGRTPYPSGQLPLSRAMQGEAVDDVEILIRTPARPEDRYISASARPLRDHTGSQLGGVVVFHDVSGYRQAEHELRRAREIAEANDRAKSEFLANMSHEIRTPLTSVLGFSDLLMDHTLGESNRLNYIQAIRRNGEHLLALISDILDLSKINANKLQVEKIVCSLPQILHEVSSVMQVRALDKGLRFHLDYETPIPERIHSDPTRVRQILFNLLSNAVKFTHQGEVNLTARCLAPDNEPARVEIDVSDTGIGLSDEEIEQLFRAFHQANTSTTREFGGTGLGLTICRSLAEAMAGEIHVRSRPGEGSTFTLVLPDVLVPDTEMVSKPFVVGDDFTVERPAAEKEKRLSGRILLAEDGSDNQVLVSTLLRQHGLEVDIAANGESAVDRALDALAESRPFDLILMDMQMPKLDGYGATARLRAKGYSEPIVALTAHAMEGERERCLAAGCDDYLTKPIARLALLAAVESHLRGEPEAPAQTEPLAGQNDLPLHADGAVHSCYTDDPDMAELVTGFVERLPAQVAEIQAALEADESDSLIRIAHQIKGAAGGYGFMAVSAEAAALEAAARKANEAGEVSEAVQRFAALCERVRAD